MLKIFSLTMVGSLKGFVPYCQQRGILPRLSCPHTHQQKRQHRHIVVTGLTLLDHAFIILKFWVEAFQTAVFLTIPAKGPKGPHMVGFIERGKGTTAGSFLFSFWSLNMLLISNFATSFKQLIQIQ